MVLSLHEEYPGCLEYRIRFKGSPGSTYSSTGLAGIPDGVRVEGEKLGGQRNRVNRGVAGNECIKEVS